MQRLLPGIAGRLAATVVLVPFALSLGPRALVGQAPDRATAAVDSAGAPFAVEGGGNFVENRGQWPDHVRYRALFGALRTWVHADGWTLHVEWSDGPATGPTNDPAGLEPVFVPRRGAAVAMRVVGGKAVASAVGDPAPVRRNWLIGNDPSAWVTDVREVPAVRLRELVPGVDAMLRSNGGRFEYDLHVAAGTDLGTVVFCCDGAELLAADDGGLLLRTEVGDFRQTPPVAWTVTASGRRPVACSVQVLDATSFRFAAPQRQVDEPLVVDPGIVWATRIGSSLDDGSQGCRPGLDAAGNVYVGGLVNGTNFPATPGAFQVVSARPGTQKGWLGRFTPTGVPQWITYIGGFSGHDRVRSLFVEPGGVVTACGPTSSADFPMRNAFDPIYNGLGPNFWGDVWIARLDPTRGGTTQLVWSTFVGGSSDERAETVHVGAGGVVTVVGWTFSTNMPGVSLGTAFQSVLNGPRDAFVVRLDPAQAPASQLLYFTLFGGSGDDFGSTTLVDGTGVVTFHGATTSTDLPTTAGALASTLNGPSDMFVARIDPSLPPAAQLLYSTYIGASGDEFFVGDAVMDGAGVVTVASWSSGTGFPTTPGAFQANNNGGYDAVVYRIDPARTGPGALLWSTYVGGPGDEGANGVQLGQDGSVFFGGTSSLLGGLPLTPTAQQSTFLGGGSTVSDAFVARLDATGSQLLYSSYLGGATGEDFFYGLVLDPTGDVLAHGLTTSTDFPATSGTPQGAQDVWVARLSLLPQTMARFGAPTPGCLGTPQPGADSNPAIGNAQFGLTCIGAPPSSAGLLGWSSAPLATPIPLLGIDLWINPAAGVLTFFVLTDAKGSTFFPLALPNSPSLVGGAGHTQFAFFQSCPLGTLASSCGMSLVIQ